MYLRVLCLVGITSIPSAQAQACFSTAERAAQSIVGSLAQDSGVPGAIGFRAQDVQVDALLHRAWVRVRRCDAPNAPLVLIPLQANIAGSEQLPQRRAAPAAGFVGSQTAGDPALSQSASGLLQREVLTQSEAHVAAIHAGEAVLVTFASSAVHMELEGTADGAAALGEPIGVLLQRRGDEPPHRMRGILRAGHRVEVQR